MKMQAVFRDTVIAESDNTVVVEGNHYFPEDSLRREHFQPSSTTSICPWKGEASYYSVEVGGAVSADAAWTYLTPSEKARRLLEGRGGPPGTLERRLSVLSAAVPWLTACRSAVV